MATTWLQTRIVPTNYHSIFKEQPSLSKPLGQKQNQVEPDSSFSDSPPPKSGSWSAIKFFATYLTLLAGGRRQMREVTSGGSFLAANDPRVLFGLGAAETVDSISVRWPSGARSIEHPACGQREIVIHEP